MHKRIHIVAPGVVSDVTCVYGIMSCVAQRYIPYFTVRVVFELQCLVYDFGAN